LAVGIGIVVGVVAHFAMALFPNSALGLGVPVMFVVALIVGYVSRTIVQAVLAPILVLVLATVVDCVLLVASGTPFATLPVLDFDPYAQPITIAVWAGLGVLGYVIRSGGRVSSAVTAGVLVAISLASIIHTVVVASWSAPMYLPTDALANDAVDAVAVAALFVLRKKPKSWMAFALSVVVPIAVLGALFFGLPLLVMGG
jgi:hypothetical protein